MNNQKKKLLGFLMIIGGPLLLLAIAYFVKWKPKSEKLEKSNCFTISEPITKISNDEGGHIVYYTYYVDEVRYVAKEGSPEPWKIEGKKIKVHYVCNEPEISELVVEYE